MRVLLLSILLLGACSHGRTMRASEASEAASPPAAPRERHPAAVALEDDARRAANAGDLAKAATTLERALRIAPDDPHLWLELAKVRLAQEDRARAETLAAKAASLAGGDEALRREARAVETRARAK